MPQKCPYCDKEVAARGRKNHVRLMSGDGHGPKGEVPDSFENDVQAAENGENDDAPTDGPEQNETDSTPSDAASDGDGEAAEVTADEIGETTPEGVADDGDDGDGYPFDPDDDDAIELDGNEDIYVRHNGKVVQADVDAGDWLLITDAGPVLYDDETGERFEVVTA